jgi:ribosomal-protein-alanine N-acetyltransferase
MFPETLDSPSLTLRQFAPDTVDAEALYELFRADREDADEVFAHVPQDPYDTPKDARDQLEEAAEAWTEGEEAQYAVYADGALAGHTGLVVEWERRAARIGVILAKPFWGNGYARECADALAELAFGRLDLDAVAIGHEDGNEKSASVVQSFADDHGGRYDGRLRQWTRVGDEVRDHHRYTVLREEWEGSE